MYLQIQKDRVKYDVFPFLQEYKTHKIFLFWFSKIFILSISPFAVSAYILPTTLLSLWEIIVPWRFYKIKYPVSNKLFEEIALFIASKSKINSYTTPIILPSIIIGEETVAINNFFHNNSYCKVLL